MELLVCPWLTFFGFAETSKLLGTEAVRILKAHAEFLIEEAEKRHLLYDEPGNCEYMHARAIA